VEYQPQIRVRDLNKDADGRGSENEERATLTRTGSLYTGRSDPVRGKQPMRRFHVLGVTTR
jgi:hypothetical protein